MRSPSWCRLPVRFAITGIRGARHSTRSSAARRRSAAGAIKGVWKAALTLRGMTRFAPATWRRWVATSSPVVVPAITVCVGVL